MTELAPQQQPFQLSSTMEAIQTRSVSRKQHVSLGALSLLFQGLLVLSIVASSVVAVQAEPHPALEQPLSIATTATATATATATPAKRALKKESTTASSDTNANDLWCKIVVFDVLFAATEAEVVAQDKSDVSTTTDVFFGCYPVTEDLVSERHYNIELPDAVVASQPAMEDLDNWWVAIPGGTIDNEVVVVPDASSVYTATGPPVGRRLSQQQLDRHHSRRLADVTGNLKVLVVYITAKNARPTPSTETVYQTAFENDVSLKYQFARCSLNKLLLEPTALGVLDVKVNLAVGSTDKTLFVNAAEDLALARIQQITGDTSITNTRQYADLVMYIVPPGTGNWLAYASVGGGMSVYNDEWGIFLSATAHEIGHNFQLYHAGEGSSEYSDHTGFMSGAIIGVHDKINYPKQCYNAQNHWSLGWYPTDKMQTVTPSTTATLVKIVAFADVATATASADKVLVQTGGNSDIYMQYNRAKGFNADTYEYQDKLVIVRDKGGGTIIEATLDMDNQAVYTRQENGNSKPLRVEVCSQVFSNSSTKPDYLVVGIGYSTSTLCTVQTAAAAVTQTVSTLSGFTGLGGFTAQQVCFKSGADCSFDEECCTFTCHNDQCGGSYPATKDISAFIILGDIAEGRQRGTTRRGLRGLKGATRRHLVQVQD